MREGWRAAALAAVVVASVLVAPVSLAGTAGASTVDGSPVTDPADGPNPGAENVVVVQLELGSDDVIVNDHDGTVDAEAGDPVGTFGSDASYEDRGGTGYDSGDEVLIDSDGDGAYTASADVQVSGLPVGSKVTTTDGFDGDWSLDSFDADESDGGWDASTDAVVIESGSGGTYSTGADAVINAGRSSFVDIAAGKPLEPMSDISGAETGPHLVDSNRNGEFDAGEDTVEDLDEDDQYTDQADAQLDANAGGGTNDPAFAAFDAPAGASMTGAETVSIPAGGDAPSNGNALYYVDSDGSGGYTTSDELVLDPSAGSAGDLTYDADGASDEDGDTVAGDDVLLFKGDDFDDKATEGDTLHQFVASDNVAFEDSGHDGTDDDEYQTGEEIYVDYAAGGTVSTSGDTDLNEDEAADRTAGDPLVPLNGLDSPSNLRWWDEDTNDGYDAYDEIVVDHDGDGVYTASADSVVVGATPAEGVTLATGQDGDWSVDSHDAVDGDAWRATTDGLFVDGGDGAYSTDDALVAGERLGGGTAVTTADGFDGDWSLDSFDADDTDGGWEESTDAVVLERGNDAYDAGFDTALNTGTDGDIDTLDGQAVEPMGDLIVGEGGVHLVDSNDNGEFDAGEDVVSDLDQDDKYTTQADTGIDKDGTSTRSDYGDIEAVRSLSVTGAETVSTAAAADGGTAPSNGNALYYVDSDGTPGYSADDELVLEPNAGTTDSLTLDAAGSDEDGDGSAGDDIVLSSGQDDTNDAAEGDTLRRFQSSDHVAFEDDGEDGDDDGQYQDGEDVLVDYLDGGTVSKGADTVANDGGSNDRSAGDPLIRLDEVDEPAGIGWLDEDTNNVYTNGDEIVVDEPDDDTYTRGVDVVVGGTPPADGATLPAGETLDDDWSVDSYDASDGGSWDGTADALFVDGNGGGTFSTVTDTRVNAGGDGTFDVSEGDPLSDLDESTYGYVDVDGNGLDTGDGVYREGDAASLSGAGGFGDTLTSLEVEQTGTLDTAAIDSVDLYRDDGDGTLEPGGDDTLVRSGASRSGSTYTFSGLSQSFGTDGTTFFVAVDLASDAPGGETLGFDVPAGGIGFAQDSDAGGLTGSHVEIDAGTDDSVPPDGTPPEIEIAGAGSVDVGEQISINASGTTDNRNHDWQLEYVWRLGDGTVASGDAITHTYAEPGTYTVNLTVTDTVGNAASRTTDVTVRGVAVTDDPGTVNATAGQTATVSTTVTNTRSTNVTRSFDLLVNGTVRATETPALGPGESATVTFSLPTTGLGPGTHTYAIRGANDSTSGTLRTTAPDYAVDPARTLAETAAGPGETVDVALAATATGPTLTVRESFEPAVAGASVRNVTVDGASVDPTRAVANGSGVAVTLDGLVPGERVTVSYGLSLPANATGGATHAISGSVATNWTDGRHALERVSVAVVTDDDPGGDDGDAGPGDGDRDGDTGDGDRDGDTGDGDRDGDTGDGDRDGGEGGAGGGVTPVDRYDADGDGEITIEELGDAAADYATEDLTITELGAVAAAYAMA